MSSIKVSAITIDVPENDAEITFIGITIETHRSFAVTVTQFRTGVISVLVQSIDSSGRYSNFE